MLAQLEDAPEQRRKAMYLRGVTTTFACHDDPRFSFCLYVPEDHDAHETSNLLVSVHGSGRLQHLSRERFVEFGRYTNTVVLAPLFPVGVLGDGNGDGYKYIQEGDIRYDLVLLSMVAQAERMLERTFERFMMFGFSGGAHFTHRFLYLHPERLAAVSIAAPGAVTLPDEEAEWWTGVGDMAERFGKTFNPAAMRGVAAQLMVGAADRETWEIHPAPAAVASGLTRVDRLRTLDAALRGLGMETRHEEVPGVAHNMSGLAPYAVSFFRQVLAAQNAKDECNG